MRLAPRRGGPRRILLNHSIRLDVSKMALLMAILGSWAAAIWRAPGTDTSILLYLARLTARGAVMGRDFFEANPPLAVWLGMPAVVAAPLLHLPIWSVFSAQIVIISTAAWWLAVQIDRTNCAQPAVTHHLSWLASLSILPAFDFGQREHVSVSLVLPLCIAAGKRWSGAGVPLRLACVAGILAGMACAIKPFFFLPVLALGTATARHLGLRHTLRCPEFGISVIVTVLFAALVVLRFPDYVHFAVEHAAPYSRYMRASVSQLIFSPTHTVLILLGPVAWVRMRAAGVRSDLGSTLLLASLGFWGGALVQGKGFGYHYLPAVVLSWIAAVTVSIVPRTAQGQPEHGGPRVAMLRLLGSLMVGLGIGHAVTVVDAFRNSSHVSPLALTAAALPVVLLPLLRDSRPRAARVWIRRAATLAAVGSLADVMANASPRRHPDIDPTVWALLPHARSAGHEGIAVLSSNPVSAWPLTLLADTRWTLRYISLWPLPALYPPEHARADTQTVTGRAFIDRLGFERRFGARVVEDLHRNRPALILAMRPDPHAHHDWGGATRFDYIAYFSADPLFREVLQDYSELEPVGRYRVFRRWNRPTTH